MTDPTQGLEPPLHAEIDIQAEPARVWAVLTDFRNLVDASPELVAMIPLLPGGLRVGQNYLGLNRRKAAVWPTRNVIVTARQGQAVGWDTTSSGARWVFELTPTASGTRLSQRREIPDKRTRLGELFARFFLGGKTDHDTELVAAMTRTLAHLKQVAES